MRIGELSKMYGGVDRRTIDFYTGKGLLIGKQGENSKYRDYDQDDVERLGKILIFREMGLSISEIEAALNDDSYWTPARIDQHITMLQENQARENERYDQMIAFAKGMKELGMAPLRYFKPDGIPVDLYVKCWVSIYPSLKAAWENDQSEDIAQLNDMLDAFISHMANQMNEGYDTAATQSLVERLANRLLNSIGTIMYLSLSQMVDSGALDAIYEQQLTEDEDYDEDDIRAIKALINDMFMLVAEWCRTAKSQERICEPTALQQELSEKLIMLRAKHDDDDEDPIFSLNNVSEILDGMIGSMTAASLLDTFISPMACNTENPLEEIKPGLSAYIRSAIEFYVNTSTL